MVGLLAEHAQQGAQALERRAPWLRTDRSMGSCNVQLLGITLLWTSPEILITTALTITPGLLQRGRARESAEMERMGRDKAASYVLQRGRARESAEMCRSAGVRLEALGFNGAALVRARRSTRWRPAFARGCSFNGAALVRARRSIARRIGRKQ